MRYSQNQNTNLMDYSMIRYLWLHKIDKNEDFEQMTAFLEPNYTKSSTVDHGFIVYKECVYAFQYFFAYIFINTTIEFNICIFSKSKIEITIIFSLTTLLSFFFFKFIYICCVYMYLNVK